MSPVKDRQDTVILHDGTVLVGRIVNEDGDWLTLADAVGGIIVEKILVHRISSLITFV